MKSVIIVEATDGVLHVYSNATLAYVEWQGARGIGLSLKEFSTVLSATSPTVRAETPTGLLVAKYDVIRSQYRKKGKHASL